LSDVQPGVPEEQLDLGASTPDGATHRRFEPPTELPRSRPAPGHCAR